MTMKGDLINGAYSQLKISGLTVQPTPEDISLALDRLENMAEEFRERNICLNYFFEDDPDPNTLHNIPRKYWHSVETNLAVRLCPDFGKVPPDVLLLQSQAGYSFLSSSTAIVRPVQYPSRQPMGSGTRWYGRYQKYFRPQAEPPQECKTVSMYIDDIQDFTEHYEAYLRSGETVISHTIEADTGLTIVSNSLSSPEIDYRIQADGSDSESDDNWLQVKIVATTSLGRIITRFINFQLLDSDL